MKMTVHQIEENGVFDTHFYCVYVYKAVRNAVGMKGKAYMLRDNGRFQIRVESTKDILDSFSNDFKKAAMTGHSKYVEENFNFLKTI